MAQQKNKGRLTKGREGKVGETAVEKKGKAKAAQKLKQKGSGKAPDRGKEESLARALVSTLLSTREQKVNIYA